MPHKIKRKMKAGVPRGPKSNNDEVWNRNIHAGPDERELSHRFAEDRFSEEHYPSFNALRDARFRPYGPNDERNLRRTPSPKGLGKIDNIQEETLERRKQKPSPNKKKRSPSPLQKIQKKKTAGSPSPRSQQFPVYDFTDIPYESPTTRGNDYLRRLRIANVYMVSNNPYRRHNWTTAGFAVMDGRPVRLLSDHNNNIITDTTFFIPRDDIPRSVNTDYRRSYSVTRPSRRA